MFIPERFYVKHVIFNLIKNSLAIPAGLVMYLIYFYFKRQYFSGDTSQRNWYH